MATYVGPGGRPSYPGYRPQSRRKQAVGTIGAGRSFNNLPAIIAAFPDAISSIIRETTEDTAREAQSRAPLGTRAEGGHKPGTLRASMKTRYSRRRADGMVLSGRIDFKAKDPTRADAKHLYAWYVEWGTVHQPAQHFLLPAVTNNRPRFLAKLGKLEQRLPG